VTAAQEKFGWIMGSDPFYLITKPYPGMYKESYNMMDIPGE
jgi:hypothetical protein